MCLCAATAEVLRVRGDGAVLLRLLRSWTLLPKEAPFALELCASALADVGQRDAASECLA